MIANVYDVDYRGGRLDYGLDDGTGRIKAYQWDIDGQDAERELAEYESQCVILLFVPLISANGDTYWLLCC